MFRVFTVRPQIFFGLFTTRRVPCKDSDQTARMHAVLSGLLRLADTKKQHCLVGTECRIKLLLFPEVIEK